MFSRPSRQAAQTPQVSTAGRSTGSPGCQPATPGAELRDRAGDLVPEDERRRLEGRRVVVDEVQVGVAEAARGNLAPAPGRHAAPGWGSRSLPADGARRGRRLPSSLSLLRSAGIDRLEREQGRQLAVGAIGRQVGRGERVGGDFESRAPRRAPPPRRRAGPSARKRRSQPAARRAGSAVSAAVERTRCSSCFRRRRRAASSSGRPPGGDSVKLRLRSLPTRSTAVELRSLPPRHRVRRRQPPPHRVRRRQPPPPRRAVAGGAGRGAPRRAPR